MNVLTLEEFIESLCDSDKTSVEIDYNSHKSGYRTAKDEENTIALDPGVWVNSQERTKALDTNNVWTLNIYHEKRDRDRKVGSSLLSVISAFSKKDITEELSNETSQVETLLKSLLLGKHTSAYIELTTGRMVSYSKESIVRESIAQMIESDKENDCELDWVGPYEEVKAIERNKLWRIQWYPHTPVGCYQLNSSTLQLLVDSFQ